MNIDVFAGDGFSMSSLTAAINKSPHQPGLIGEMGLFNEDSVSTTTVQLEIENGNLRLVSTSPRGSETDPTGANKRDLVSIVVPHLQRDASILADEIQNLRAFGSETDMETMQGFIDKRLAKMRRDLDVTLEYHRAGAINGQVLDADGASVVLDLFQAFGVTKTTHTMDLATSTTKIRTKIMGAMRKSENVLGSAASMGYVALCSDSFFDAFVDHDNVIKSYERFNEGELLRSDSRRGFRYGEVNWVNYRGKVGSNAFIPDGEARLVPMGVTDLLQTVYAPADYTESANTLGLPYYAKQEPKRFGKGVDLQAQTNPLCFSAQPNAIVHLQL